VCPTWAESGSRRRGAELPVFTAPGLGTVGMLICYDMVMPETSRALALRGAEVIFIPTMGGAAIGDEEIGLAAMRVRAVDNFVWLVVAQRGGGAMVISPQGKIVARAEGPNGLAIADIDPLGGREGGDSANHQRDMRARLFRERNPAAFAVLTDPEPPVLARVPLEISREEAARIAARMLTVGEEEFKAAGALSASGKKQEAVEAFGRLCREYRDSWIDTESARRLRELGAEPPAAPRRARGIAADHPRDRGIAEDPRVLFAEDFESGSLEEIKKRWTDAKDPAGAALALVPRSAGEGEAGRCLQVSATPGQNDGGYLYRRLARGVEKLHARFYVKFAADPDYLHHFVALGGYQPATNWPQGGAGERPKGDDRIYVGIEPHGNYGQFPAPGAWSFYDYWGEMKISADGKYWGNAIRPEVPLLPPRGRWQCVEVMVKLNSKPEKADGELALWLDGVEAMRIGPGTRRGPWSGMGFDLPKEGGEPFEGFRWRTSEELKLNWFWLLHYVTPHAAQQNRKDEPTRPNRVWFDDVVLATEYIGPLSTATGD
jgi:carbon-nitrogen hydrolase